MNSEKSSDSAAAKYQAFLDKKSQEKKGEKKIEVKGNGVNALTLLWKKRMSLMYEGPVKITQEDSFKFKHVIAGLGAEQAKDVLDWVLLHWGKFANEVQIVKGISGTPAQPSVGFFVMYYDVAAQLIAKLNKPKPSQSYTNSQSSPTTVMKKPLQTATEELATPADLQAALLLIEAQKGKK